MRRVVLSVIAVLLGASAPLAGVAVGGAVAFAAPAPTTPPPVGNEAPAAVPGKALCTIRDSRLISLSGLGIIPTGFVVINDNTGSNTRDRVFFLDKSCKVASRTVTYPNGARDPEDLAIGKDGAVWVADIGDDPLNPTRTSIGVWKVPASGSQATLYRMRYPDGKHDAEAMLLDANDQPIILTKEAGVSRIYTPATPIAPISSNSQGVALKKVGEFRPQRTGTSTPLSLIGQLQVSGAANSPDRTKVVVRTLSDAYEWDVPDGDVVKAITTGKPRITPLPEEPQGEAIAYSADGGTFYTVSDTEELPRDVLPQILQYTPVAEVKPPPATAGAAGPEVKRNTLSWYDRLSLTEVTSLIGGVGVIGVLMVVAGVIGIIQARKRGKLPPKDGSPHRGGGTEPAVAMASNPPGVYGRPYSEYGGGYDEHGNPRRR
jgi:hypothetical protein